MKTSHCYNRSLCPYGAPAVNGLLLLDFTWLIIAMLLIFRFISNESTIIFSANWFLTIFRCIINLFSHFVCHWPVVLDGISININLIFDTCKAYLALNITSFIQYITSFHTQKTHINSIQYYTIWYDSVSRHDFRHGQSEK